MDRGLAALQADLRKRASSLPPRPDSAPPAGAAGPAGWQLLSPGTSRASATLVEAIHRVDGAALAAQCTLTESLTVQFRYRWVRARYEADDHGQITAVLPAGSTAEQSACVLEQLTASGILGKRSLGRRPFVLEARLHLSQDTSP